MTTLTTKKRKAIPKSEFALPEKRAYPIEDKAHARNAKARAAEEFLKGNLSSAERAQIDRKADELLGGA